LQQPPSELADFDAAMRRRIAQRVCLEAGIVARASGNAASQLEDYEKAIAANGLTPRFEELLAR
jgi:hypothetical protein